MKKFLASIIIVCIYVVPSLAQNQIHGTVTDESNVPVTGATVLNTTSPDQYAITDDSGAYSMKASEGDVLEVSFLGYLTQNITVGKAVEVNITLRSDFESIDEVMVTAYGTTKKSSFTGSAAVVRNAEIQKMNGSGFSDALQGMSAGVQVSSFSGNPGAEARIQIRGISSMSGSSAPLYIVDGMAYDGGLNSINPSDIESLTVLKDAAASSLYGSRAANGVIIITTKKGAAGNGNIQVNVRAAWGTSDNAVPYPKTVADPKQTLLNNWEAFYNDFHYAEGMSSSEAGDKASSLVVSNTLKQVKDSQGNDTFVSPFVNGIDATQWVLHDGNGNPRINPDLKYAWNESDWDVYGAVTKYKLRQDYGIDVNGTSNSGKTNYFLSAGYLDDGGFLLNQYYKRYTFRTNVTTQATKWLQVGGSVSYTYYRQNVAGSNRALIWTSTLGSPWLRNKDNTDWCYSEKTGQRMYSFGDYVPFFGIHAINNNGDYWNNPNDESFNSNDGHNVTARYFMEFSLPVDIKFRTSVNLDASISNNYGYGSAVHGSQQKAPWGVTVMDEGGSASRSSSQNMSVTWNNILNWGHQWGDHRFDVMLGHEMYSMNKYAHNASGEGIMQIGQYEMSNTTRNWSASSGRDRYSLLSFLGKVDYNFAGRYYVSASYRRDGSSRFSEQNRWGDFFSVGASWRMSAERWMQGASNWLQNLVFRASYGTSGNDKLIQRNANGTPGGEILYGYQGMFASDNLYNLSGLKPVSIATPELRWEKNKQFNVAADMTLFKILTMTFEYYQRRSDGLLYYKTFPPSAQVGGVTGYNTNVGTLQNSGFEFTLGIDVFHRKNFNWRIDGNVSTLTNKIVSLPSDPFFWSNRAATYYMCEGNSLYDFYAPRTDGIDSETGLVRYIKADGSITNTVTDLTHDDYRKIGSSLPKAYGSITNSFGFYGVDISFMFYFSVGSYMYDYEYYERTKVCAGISVVQDLMGGVWKKPGDNASMPRLTMKNWSTMIGYSDRYLFKNDFVRLRNLTIGYSLPSKIINRAKISKLRFYVSGDNLLTFGSAARRYSDPETGVSGNNYNGNAETDSGIQGGRRVFMGGVQISF